MILYTLLFMIVPIVLVIAAEALIRKRGNPEMVERRYFLLLAWTSMGLLAIIMVLYWLMPPMGYGIPNLLAPALAGVVAITLLHFQDWRKLHDGEKKAILYTLIALTILILVQFVAGRLKGAGGDLETILLGVAVITVSTLLAVIWRAGKRRPILVGMLAVLYMLVFNVLEGGSLPFFDETPKVWLSIVTAAIYLILPILVISSATMLVSTLISPPAMSGETGTTSWPTVTGRLLLVIVLLGLFLYTIVWLCIWDGTDDGVRGIIILMLSMLAAVAGGMVILMTSAGWRRWIGVVFAILMIVLVRWAITIPNNRYSPYEMTEARAAQIQSAIEKYHARTGWYPFHLSDLVPRELWRIPLPMIMPDDEWCYQGSSNTYRLGTIYREHWSSPYLSVRTYASAGNIPEEPWACDEELAELLSQSNLEAVATPDSKPQPTSEIPVERTLIEPILRATSLTVGDWSPDGDYLVFGETRLTGDAEEPVEINLQFLRSKTGEICTAAENIWNAGERSDGLHQHYIWLPDGRFLYVSESGEMVLFQPCVDGAENLTDRYSANLTQVSSFDATSGHAVLMGQDSYWLLDGTTLEIQQIPGVLPNSSIDGRDWISWSPDRDRLAISQMEGQDASTGAILFIIDEASGAVEMQIPLMGNTETADGPIVDWLTGNELLVQFAGSLLVLDIQSEPVKTTDLVRDIFLLDLSYPFDISSMDFIRYNDSDGYGVAVRANHPHNQDVYLYDSQTGKVQMFQHDVSTLLFFPDGQWMQAPKWEDNPSYNDEYEMVWMDRPEESQRLIVSGHVPRDHPQIFPKYLPASSQLVFSSSQGISLVSIPDGEMLRFWVPAGGDGISNRVLPSPRGDALVILVDGVGLYHIPLPSK